MEQENKITDRVFLVDHDWSQLNELILAKTGKIYVLVDENTHEHCYTLLIHKVPSLRNSEIIELQSGEENKILQNCISIWESMSESYAGRDSLVINLGGGVITDLGGFVASVYKRGVEFVNIPTSLLGMVDASIGGKTGVDFMGFKNQLGVYQQAVLCLIYPDFLKSLSRQELYSGFAELIKHALITENPLWKLIEGRSLEDLEMHRLIPMGIQVKSSIVSEDPLEAGKRKLLNFGHTIGHSLESFFLQKTKGIPHGEAVAAGMICELYLSSHINNLAMEEMERIIKNIDLHFSRLEFKKNDIPNILKWMEQDKKNIAGKKAFTLLSKIGQVNWAVEVDDKSIEASLLFYLNEKQPDA